MKKIITIDDLVEGKSGSLIIDIDGESVKIIAIDGFIDIDMVLEAIDNLK